MSAVAIKDLAFAGARRAPHLGPIKYLSVALTHEGRVRQLNEDAFFNRPDIGLWAVADGMGGHASGEVASARVVAGLSEVDCFRSAYAFRDRVSASLHRANTDLRTQAKENFAGTMGATVTALIAHGGHFACLWAGDSRCYHYRDGLLTRVTRDHSLVQEMIDAGQLPANGRHANANMITRAVGAADLLELDSVYGVVHAGDRFLLCSDGLSGVVTDAEIADLMARPPFEAAAQRLLNLALTRGAPDNVTLVLVGAENA